MTRSSRARTAWALLGLGGAFAGAVTIVLTIAIGLASEELLIFLTFITAGLLGALVAAREPDNPIGWLMSGVSVTATLFFLPLDYGYWAQVIERGTWPLGGVALWVGAWVWAPAIGLFLPMLTVRFPDGKAAARWRSTDWLAAAGTATYAAGVALARPEVLVRLLLIPHHLIASMAGFIHNPLGGLAPTWLAGTLIYVGFALMLLAYAAAVASVVDRFRHARGDYQLQLKWFVYAGAIVGTALVYGSVVQIFNVFPPDDIDVVLHLSFFALPLSIAIAILRYRLYDIDVIINRSLVYGGMTAILGAVYAAVVTLLNRLFIAASGQKSDAAYVVTAFVVVVASSPVKDWLQRQVDSRIGHRSPSAVLNEFRADVEAVVSVIDVHRVAHRLLDQAAAAFDARGAALYLRSSDPSNPLYSRGRLDGEVGIEVLLRYEDQQLGRLVLGTRRGDAIYTEHDRELLQSSADSVGEALALAAHLGFRPLPRARTATKT